MAKAIADYSAKLWLAEDKLRNRIDGDELAMLRMDRQ